MSPSQKVWLITGCSTGFGHALALAALNRGDLVIATARKLSALDSLKAAGASVLQLNVTDPLSVLKEVAAAALSIHGRIDILMNNAGYVLDGAIEETSEKETLDLFNTNFFGLLNVTRAFAPAMREARSGVIANISSIGGWRGYAGCGLYAASKAAVSNISESLYQELKPFGISVCCIEPGYFRSNLLNPGNRNRAANPIKEYEGTTARTVMEMLDGADNNQPGDIKKGVKVIVDVLTSSGVAEGREVPMRLALGSDAYPIITDKCKETITLLDEWKDITTTTDHDDVKKE
jgi:NAD(P)-dependent dehydrogenase (short-subunit alcohol dehydrogenase family)